MILDTNSVCGAIDNNLAELIHTIITIMKFGIPILLIIFGMLDFSKGVIANKEDEIKSGQRLFIKRLIAAVLVFFVSTIVQLAVGLADDKNESNKSDAWECANMILNGKTTNTSSEKNTNMSTNDKIQKCCNQVGGTLSESGNNMSCTTTPEQSNKYNECFKN